MEEQARKIAGILESEKQGMNVLYRLEDKRAAALLEPVKEYYCAQEV